MTVGLEAGSSILRLSWEIGDGDLNYGSGSG